MLKFYVSECFSLPVFLFNSCTQCPGMSEDIMDSLEMEFHLVVSHYVGPGNKNRVSFKSNKCF